MFQQTLSRSPKPHLQPSSRASEVSILERCSLVPDRWSEGSQLLIFVLPEVYRFLSSEVRAYLPSYETVTIYHLRDLAMGVKTIINCDDVKVIDVPQFEGLTIQDIFTFASNDQAVERALPPGKEISKLSRAYLANVIYTIMGQAF